jgi:F-type H+-transporting ATPase subunit epsilon
MIVEVLTPEKKLFSGDAKGVQCPGVSGLFEVLDNHAPMIAALGMGKVNIKTNEGTKSIKISGGFMECLQNKVVVLVEGGEIEN